jgi:hypothetical protein
MNRDSRPPQISLNSMTGQHPQPPSERESQQEKNLLRITQLQEEKKVIISIATKAMEKLEEHKDLPDLTLDEASWWENHKVLANFQKEMAEEEERKEARKRELLDGLSDEDKRLLGLN